jgi:hypothetical protein
MKSILNSIKFVSIGLKTKKWWMCPLLFEDFMTKPKVQWGVPKFARLKMWSQKKQTSMGKTW